MVRRRLQHLRTDGHYDTSYRITKDRDESERIVEKIYNRKIDEEGFRWRTRPLYPYVAAVYGWKTRQHKLDKAASNAVHKIWSNREPSPFTISSIPFL